MTGETQTETIFEYFGRFSANVSSSKNNNVQSEESEKSGESMFGYFQRFSDSFIKEKEEVEDILDEEIISPISKENLGIEMTVEELVDAVNSSVDNELPLGIIQSKFHLFKDCKNWRDVSKKLRKVYKENIMVQTFALGVAMVISPEVIPPLKYVVGPAMVKTGYSNSEFLQKKVKKSLIDNYAKIDYEKGSETL